MGQTLIAMSQCSLSVCRLSVFLLYPELPNPQFSVLVVLRMIIVVSHVVVFFFLSLSLFLSFGLISVLWIGFLLIVDSGPG